MNIVPDLYVMCWENRETFSLDIRIRVPIEGEKEKFGVILRVPGEFLRDDLNWYSVRAEWESSEELTVELHRCGEFWCERIRSFSLKRQDLRCVFAGWPFPRVDIRDLSSEES